MQTKRILIISQIPVFNIKGKAGIQVLSKTIDGYISKGYQVDIIYPAYKNINIEKSDPRNKHNEFTFNAKIYHFFASSNYFSYLAKILFWRVFYRKVKNIVQSKLFENNYDVVYGIGPMGNYTACKLHFKNDPVKVARYLGVASGFERYSKAFSRFLAYPDLLGYKMKSDVIIMTNDGTRGDKFLRTVNAKVDNIVLLRNGIDKNLFTNNKEQNYLREKYKIDKSTKILLVVSRLTKLKRIDRSISVVEELTKKDKNFILFVAGSGGLLKKFQNIVNKKKLNNHIIFTGPIQHKELINYYSSADIFMSFYDTSNAGNPLYEAMLTGNCVITINTGNTKEFVCEGTGIVFDSFNPKTISKKIKELLADDQERRKIGENARKHASKELDSWEERINKEIKIVESLKKTIH